MNKQTAKIIGVLLIIVTFWALFWGFVGWLFYEAWSLVNSIFEGWRNNP